MATSYSPKIVTDGLVFYYDKANAKKSWKGEPTTNVVASTVGLTHYAPYNIVTARSPGYIQVTMQAGTQYLTIHNSISYIGKTMIFSGTMHKNGLPHTLTGNVTNTYQQAATSWDFNSSTGEFVIEQYFNDASAWLWHTPANSVAGDVIEIFDWQVEEKLYPTPFVDGTRSNTESLTDMIGSNTITATSLSYTQDDFSFNGTSNYLNTSTIPSFTSSTAFTIEFVIKPTNFTNTSRLMCPNSNGIDHFVTITTSGTFQFTITQSSDTNQRSYSSTSGILTAGQYSHCALVVNGTSRKIYIDGTLDKTYTDSSGFSVANWGGAIWRIGQRGNSTGWFNGSIDMVKAYDKALTDAEVQSNAAAVAGRLG